MAKKIKNERCPLQGECGRSCEHVGAELKCDYYRNNGIGDNTIPDQEELRKQIERLKSQEDFEAEIAALPDDEDLPTIAENKLVYIPIGELYPHPDNPRKDLGDLTELAESIKAKGVMQNLTVVPRGEGGYTVIIGHRRMGASKLAGLTELPCVIVEMSPREQLATMLLENMQRSDLTAYEQAQGFQMMIDFGDTVEGIAEKTGFSKKTVKHRLEMAKLNKKTLQEVSVRQVTMDDFDKLSKIKSLKKRNEVLTKIGTFNFDSAVENALREELIAEKMPPFLQKAKELGATAMKDEDRWSNKYERIADIDVKVADVDKPLVPKKYQSTPLFYSVRDHWGTLEIYRKRPKDAAKKRPKAEIDREKAIDECKKDLKALTETARTLRGNFAKQLVMNSKNRERILAGAVAVLECGVVSYMYSVHSKTVLEFIGNETSTDYNKNQEVFQTALRETPNKVIPALIYLYFENDRNAKYYMEQYNDFPKHQKDEWLDMLYEWLVSLGYEMSDDEQQLMDGTHPLFANSDAPTEKIDTADDTVSQSEESNEDLNNAPPDKIVDQLREMYGAEERSEEK